MVSETSSYILSGLCDRIVQVVPNHLWRTGRVQICVGFPPQCWVHHLKFPDRMKIWRFNHRIATLWTIHVLSRNSVTARWNSLPGDRSKSRASDLPDLARLRVAGSCTGKFHHPYSIPSSTQDVALQVRSKIFLEFSGFLWIKIAKVLKPFSPDFSGHDSFHVFLTIIHGPGRDANRQTNNPCMSERTPCQPCHHGHVKFPFFTWHHRKYCPLPFTFLGGQRYAKNMGHRLQGLVKADEATLEQEMRGLSKRTPRVVKPGNGKSVNHCGL
jgi:hypothetical protein